MNKTLFRLLVVLMSLSLIGIILVQLYLINTSFKNNEEQFKYHVQQVIGNVSEKLKQEETYSLLNQYNILKDSIGKDPKKSELLDFVLVQKNKVTNETVIYSNNIIAEDYNVNLSFFDKKKDSIKKAQSYSAKRKTEIYSGNQIDNSALERNTTPDITVEKSGNMEMLVKAQYDMFLKDIADTKPLKDRISKDKLQKMLEHELKQYEV